MLLPPAIERGVLLANHVLRSQPMATDRLRRHAGRSVVIVWRTAATGWPLPPSLHLLVTPAGLLERVDAGAAGPASANAEAGVLRVCIDLPAPHRLLAMSVAGERPRVDVEGDAQFAADVAWIAENLRWDVEHDLARVVGDAPARLITQLSQAAAEALRRLAQGVGSAWDRRPGGGAASPR